MNKMKQMLGRVLACALMAAVALVAAGPRTAMATPLPDASREGSIAVSVAYDGEPLSGVAFSAWRVAGFDERGHYELAGDFATSGVDLASLDKASDWDAAATQLLSWASEHGIAPGATTTTDAAGAASLTGLVPGLYLLSGSEVQLGGHVYTPSTYLESVPRAVDGDLVYNATSTCKVARTDAPVTPATPTTPGVPGADNAEQDGKDAGKTWAQRMGLVQTGDNSITARGVLVLVALGAALVVVGLVLWPRRHRNDDDDADEKR